MRSRSPAEVGASRATVGAASVTQGVYGARGNLELVVPDADDGLRVLWFNADLPDDPPAAAEVPPGTWSAGLAFAAGTRYSAAQILQSTLGPDHLEVLALSAAGVLESWYWSPGPGFQRRLSDAASDLARFVAEHEGGRLAVTVEDRVGGIRHLASDVDPYPERTWRAVASGPAFPDERVALRLLADAGIHDVTPGTARVAPSDRDGGSLELTWRDASGRLLHLALPAASG